MDKEQKLDAMLAAYTDAILAGEEGTEMDDELQQLGTVVGQLQRTIDPETPPSPAFRSRLTQRLNEEWTQVHRERRVLQFSQKRWMRMAVAVAALLMIVVGVVLLLPENSGNQEATSGGEVSAVLIVAGVGMAVALAAFFFWSQRRH